MKLSLPFLFAVLFTPLAAAPAPTSGRVFMIDAGTPAGLRELLGPAGGPVPLVSAHRGGAGAGLPENCLATFEATIRAGWSMLEIDLRPTKDGVIVLMHDATLDRTSNGSGPVQDRTLAEIRELRLKDRQGRLTEHRIPTLDEVIEWARGRTLLVLDRKEVPVLEAAKIITRHRAEAHVLLMAYSIKDIADCHALNRDIMMEVMLGTRERFEEFKRSGVPFANIIAFVGHTAEPDPELCRLIRAGGASCMAGTSRNHDRELLSGRVKTLDPLGPGYRAVLDRGVDVIETDVPRELSPLLYGGRPPSGAKAKFFRIATR